jgi:hypothetical protein
MMALSYQSLVKSLKLATLLLMLVTKFCRCPFQLKGIAETKHAHTSLPGD